MIKEYYCKNGAFHTYECCDTCWNSHPIAKNYTDYSFNQEARRLIDQEYREVSVKEAIAVGFTQDQAEYLCRNVRANFQQFMHFN